jgi:hypothetical protein
VSDSLESLGWSEILRLQSAGWRFADHGVRVKNGWAVMAVDPKGNHSVQVLADPKDEPEKWIEAEAESDQPELALS